VSIVSIRTLQMRRQAEQRDADLEAQSTVSSRTSRSVSRQSTRAEDQPDDEWVGTSLSPAKAQRWEQVIGTRPVGPRGHYNPHGLLAAHRFVCERFACTELLTNADEAIIIDVGGAPHRTFDHLGIRGRYLMPNLHIGDNTRFGRIPPDARPHVCRHAFEVCTCYEGLHRAYLFTHSGYYLDPMRTYQILTDPCVVDAIAVEHTFDDMYGGFYDEATWMMERDVLTMRVVGNGAPYVHTLPPWQTGWIGDGGEAIDAEVLKELDGVTRVVRLHPVRKAVPTDRRMVWDDVVADPHKSGPVQFSAATRNAVADNAKFTQTTFDVHNIRKFGPVLYTDFILRGETVSITVPVNAVSDVASRCLHRTRDPALYSEMAYIVKQRLGQSRIPPGKLAQVQCAVVALGFVSNLKNEMNVNYTMLDRFSWTMTAHNNLLQFGNVVVRSWVWLILVLFAFTVTLVLYEVFDDDTTQRVLGGLGAFIFASLCSWCCLGCVRLARRVNAYKEQGWVSSISDDSGPSAPLLGHSFPMTRHLPIPGSRFVKPIPDLPLNAGSVSLGASRERVFEPNRSLISGIVADGVIPTVLHTTQQAELSAVTNRVMQSRANPDPAALDGYKHAFEAPWFKSVKVGIDTTYEFFKKWLVKISKTYPQEYVRKMDETWKRFQGCMAEAIATKSFLKIEKSAATVGIDHNKETKPRLVQPPEDIDKTMTGQYVWQCYEHIRDAWNGITSPIMYCSGYSCAEIGTAVDAFETQHGVNGVVGWSVDMGGYDATLGLELQVPVFAFYVRLGMPEWVVSWLMRIRSRGQTPNGVRYAPMRTYHFTDEDEAKELASLYRKYKLKCKGPILDETTQEWVVVVEDFQMTSGRMDTNLTDTVALVAAMTPVLHTAMIPFLLLVCGDDGFLLVAKEHEDIVEKLISFTKALGLKPEGRVTAQRCMWEFCSKLFWFGLDFQTGRVQTVLGSKPFRGIARMGINTTLPGAANAAQAALSVRIDSGHVPFLGPFADRTFELCRDKRIRPVGRAEWTSIRGDKRYGCVPQNYVLCQERYALGLENETDFKARLASLDSVPIVCQWEPLVNAVRVDEV